MSDPFFEEMYQSGLIAQGCWDALDDYDKIAVLKFGELIVNHCCKMMVDLEAQYPANLTVREIKKHYGML